MNLIECSDFSLLLRSRTQPEHQLLVVEASVQPLNQRDRRGEVDVLLHSKALFGLIHPVPAGTVEREADHVPLGFSVAASNPPAADLFRGLDRYAQGARRAALACPSGGASVGQFRDSWQPNEVVQQSGTKLSAGRHRDEQARKVTARARMGEVR
jgi:hypothetical protein